jgi:hypothetical protein
MVWASITFLSHRCVYIQALQNSREIIKQLVCVCRIVFEFRVDRQYILALFENLKRIKRREK